MYCVSPELYLETAARLGDAIGDGNYFSGAIEFLSGDLICRLTISVIVYRSRISLPEGVCRPVTDLVPVWWEFHTVGEAGEMLNDFDFSSLVRCLV